VEARWQERLDETYTDLGTYLSHYGDSSRLVQPFLGLVPAPAPLPEHRWRMKTLVKLYGSPEVQKLLDDWGKQADKIENAGQVIRSSGQSSNPSAEFDQEAMREKHEFPDYKIAMYKAAEEIRNQTR
jgi:hypothetical protein